MWLELRLHCTVQLFHPQPECEKIVLEDDFTAQLSIYLKRKFVREGKYCQNKCQKRNKQVIRPNKQVIRPIQSYTFLKLAVENTRFL